MCRISPFDVQFDPVTCALCQESRRRPAKVTASPSSSKSKRVVAPPKEPAEGVSTPLAEPTNREFVILVSPSMCEAQTGFSVFQVTKRGKDGLPMLGIEQHASEKGVGKQEAGSYRFTTLLQSNGMQSKPLFGRADRCKPWTVSALTNAAVSEYTNAPPGGKGRSVRYVKLVDEAAQVQRAYSQMAACRSNW